MKKISVIIPIYNVQKYLDKCVESVINQTYKELEIFLVDDGSRDNCPIMCDKWAKKDSRIRVVHKENGGLSDARNVALDLATGDYITFVDSDDYVDLNMFKELVELLENNDADISMCSYKTVDEEGNELSLDNLAIDETLDKVGFYKRLSNFGWWFYIIACAKLYRASTLKDIRFPKGKINEDAFVMHHIVNKCTKIAITKKQLYHYVQRNNSIMNQVFTCKNLDDFEALYDRYHFFKENGYEYLIDNIRAIVADKYQRVFEELLLKDYTELKRYKAGIKFIQLMLDGENQSHPLYRKICSYPTLIYRYTYFVEQKKYHTLSYRKLIKVLLPRRIQIGLYKLICYMHSKKQRDKLLDYKKASRGKEFILVNSPTHGNLGDHAIIMSEIQLLRKLGRSFTEIPAKDLWYNEELYASNTPNHCTIIIPGGGSLGKLWPSEEYAIRRVIKAFKKNKIIIFPQTATFTTDLPEEEMFLRDSIDAYSSHPNLKIFVRDKKSYNYMKQFCDLDISYVPDIVTQFHYNQNNSNRNGVLFCLRSDIEKSIDEKSLFIVKKIIKEAYPNFEFKYTDTVLEGQVELDERKEKVHAKLNEFANSKLIITDRLHGMIFAAITNTPCISFGNSNGKVAGVYKWIEQNEYIRFANNIDEFRMILSDLDLETKYKYDYSLIEKHFDSLIDQIKE